MRNATLDKELWPCSASKGCAPRNAIDSFLGRVDENSLVLDVGAHDGRWTRSLFRLLQRDRNRDATFPCPTFYMFEPQPDLARRIRQSVVPSIKDFGCNVILEQVAAHVRYANATFYTSRNSEQASLNPITARGHHLKKGMLDVETIDLADYMYRLFGRGKGMSRTSFLKLDIESLEFDLLPHLLNTKAICYVSNVLVEWHLWDHVNDQPYNVYMAQNLQDIIEQRCVNVTLPWSRVIDTDERYMSTAVKHAMKQYKKTTQEETKPYRRKPLLEDLRWVDCPAFRKKLWMARYE